MADVNANIGVNIDASEALSQLKSLQRQISNFHTSVAKSSQAAAIAQRSLQTNLINSINSLGSFSAEFRTIKTTAESFTASLEKNKFSMREYFRYGAASTKTFGRLFSSEFDTISKVAEDRVKKLQTQYIKMGRDATGAMKAIAVIPNELNMKDVATQTQLAAQKQAILNQLIKQGSTNLLNFGKNTQWAGRQLMVGFTLPLMTLGSAASRVFMDMETAALKFRKVYGDLFTPQAETEKALANVKALAAEFTKYGIAASKTVDLAAQAAAAGFQGVDLQRQTEQATRLSVLGQIDQQKALETTISLQNAFKTSSADLAGQINFLNAVENQTVTSLDDITTAIPKVAPVIMQLGGNVKDLAFFLTAMKEGGVNASEGANALKSGLASLINPTTKASNMLKSMGIDIKAIVEKDKGNLRQTVIDFAKALDTLDPLARARAIEQLFGKFQFARLSTLFANITRDGTQASRVLDLANASASDLAMTAEKELGITANSAMNKFKKAVEDIKIAIVPLGQLFLETVTPIINFGTELLKNFQSLPDGMQKTIARVVLIVGGLGPVVLMTFGLFANAIANIIKLGNILRNGYLRLTGQSKVLGEQTVYLTDEQLNAAAVAHSLEQSHATLTQQFNVETGALNKLIAAYERANAAGAAFALANPGMMLPTRKPKKFAEGGIVRGPGTGTSDSIFAKLSNGEAVIPAKSVARNPEAVSALVSGKIPGFAKGTEFAHVGGYESVGASTLFSRIGGGESTSMTARASRILEALASKFGDALKVNVYGRLGIKTGRTSVGQSINNLLGGAGVERGEFLKDWDKQGTKRWSRSLKYAGLKMEDVSEELKLLDSGMKEYILSLDEKTKITDTEVKNAYEYAKRNKLAQSKLIASFDKLSKTAGEMRVNISQALANKFGLPVAPGGGSKGARQLGPDKIRLGGERFSFYGATGFSIVANAIGAMKRGAQKALKISSPSKELESVGKDAGEGLIIGAESKVKDAKKAGKKVAQASISPIVSQSRIRSGQLREKYGPVPAGMSPAQYYRSLREEKLKTPEKPKGRLSKLGGRFGGGMGAFGLQMGLSMMPDKIGSMNIAPAKGVASMAATGAMIGSMFPGWGTAIGAVAGGLFGLVGVMKDLKKQTEQTTESIKAGFTASETVAKLFGGTLSATSKDFTFLPGQVDQVTAKLIKAKEQADQFKQILESIDKENPLRQFIEGIKGLTGTELTGKVRGFVATQIATGALPVKEAEQFTLNILTAAGAADQFGRVWGSISTSVSTTAKAINTQYQKLGQAYTKAKELTQEEKDRIAQYEKAKQSYTKDGKVLNVDLVQNIQKEIDKIRNKSLAGTEASKNFGLSMVTLFNNISKGNVSLKNIRLNFSAIEKQLPNATDRMQAFRDAILATGDQQAIANLSANKTLLDQIAASALTAEDQMYGMIAAQVMGASLQEQLDKVDGSSTQDRLKRAAMIGKKYVDIAKAAAEAGKVETGTGGTGGAKTTKQKLIDLLDTEISKLQKKADALQKVNDEMKRQNDYMMQQAQLSKEQVQAKISGDYLGAALIGQQKASSAAEFNAESKKLNIQNQIDYIKGIQDKINNKQPLTAAEKLTISQAKNKKNLTYPGSVANYGMVSPMSGFTGATAPSYSMAGGYAGSSNTPASAAVMNTVSGGTVYNVTQYITGANAEEIAKLTIKKLKLSADKNTTSNGMKK